ncbi:MAG: hypothetical protein ACXWQO_18560 [Bdellovibrionota bacterium]
MVKNISFSAFLCFLYAPVFAVASAPVEKPVKAVCSFSGYSTDGDRPVRKNFMNFGSDTLIVNSGYDFGSKEKRLPAPWAGPKGKFFLAGSTSDPGEGWASFVLFYDYGLDKFKPVGIGSDWTVIKLNPDTQFTMRKRISETSNPEAWWYLEASCTLSN